MSDLGHYMHLSTIRFVQADDDGFLQAHVDITHDQFKKIKFDEGVGRGPKAHWRYIVNCHVSIFVQSVHLPGEAP